MPRGNLRPLQWKMLEILAGVEPSWILTGGAALVGFHFQHRTTRDVDLFWRGFDQLGALPAEIRRRLSAAGLEVEPIQSAPSFARFRVSDGADVCIVDLVAEPVQSVEPPLRVQLGTAMIAIDTAREILANKLCALLGRSELRDLRVCPSNALGCW